MIRLTHSLRGLALALPLSIFGLTTQISHGALIDGLTAYYTFDNNLTDEAEGLAGSASTVADDLAYASGHAAAYGPGLFGSGGYLGSGPGTGHAEAPHSDDVAGTGDNITVSWWGRTTGFNAAWQAGVAKGEGNNWRFHRQGNNNTIAWQGGGGDIAGTVDVNDMQWHHFVGTKDAANGRVLYVDGVQVATGPAGTPINIDPGLPLMVGENPGANNREWSGDIDDVAIWNRALTSEEVTEIFTAGDTDGLSLGEIFVPPVDTDGDGLRDDWEIANLGAGAENDDGTTNPDFGAAGDPDNDMSDNAEEQDRGTDPQDDDTDDDGLIDGVEDGGGAWVSVTETGTNPLVADSDGDGLDDGVEDNGGTFVSLSMTGTDPNNPDSDGDGANDGAEANDPSRDPNVSDTPIPDGYDDGLAIYYNFDDNMLDQAHVLGLISSTVADDLTAGGGHPGDFGPGLFGGGGYLGGGPGTGFFEAPSSADSDGTGDAITVSWWGRSTGFNAAWQAGVAKGEGNNWRFHRQGNNNTIAWQGGGGDIAGTVNVDDMEWHHFVGTKDPVDGRVLYVDGVAVATGPAGTPMAIDGSNPLYVGENPDALNRNWAGDIDDVAIWNRPLTEEEVIGLHAAGVGGESLGDLLGVGGGLDPLRFNVTQVGGRLEISWDSEPGNQYDLLSELPGNISDVNGTENWGIFAPHSAIAATPPRNTLTIDYPADPERYFAIRGGPTPPVKAFNDDLETGQGGWTVISEDEPPPALISTTMWELGAPDANLFGGPPAAHSGTNVFGTDLDANYEADTLIRLRSPAIDTTGIASGELVFWQWRDIEITFDFAQVRVLDASDLSEIAVLEARIEGSTTADWEEVSLDLPPEAINKSIIIEFVFDSDEFGNLAGYYIDDVCVQGPGL